MYSKILVVIDGFADDSHPVYGQAIRLAKNHCAHLRLLHVLPPRSDGSRGKRGGRLTLGVASSRSLWKRFDRRCMEFLKRYADQATAQGVYTDYQQVRGDVDMAICEAAREWSADLVVLGHPELQIEHRSDRKILAQVPCSTLFVKSAL